MVRQQSMRSLYMVRARYVGTPGKKTPSLLGGEGSKVFFPFPPHPSGQFRVDVG